MGQLSKPALARVISFLDELAAEGDPTASERLPGPDRELYRVQIGEHRVMYAVRGRTVLVLSVVATSP